MFSSPTQDSTPQLEQGQDEQGEHTAGSEPDIIRLDFTQIGIIAVGVLVFVLHDYRVILTDELQQDGFKSRCVGGGHRAKTVSRYGNKAKVIQQARARIIRVSENIITATRIIPSIVIGCFIVYDLLNRGFLHYGFLYGGFCCDLFTLYGVGRDAKGKDQEQGEN